MQPFSNIFSFCVLQAVSERLELTPAGGRSEPQVSNITREKERGTDFGSAFIPVSKRNIAKIYHFPLFIYVVVILVEARTSFR